MIYFKTKHTLTQLDLPWFLFRELAGAPTNKRRINQKFQDICIYPN